jgi:hypothetical protein
MAFRCHQDLAFPGIQQNGGEGVQERNWRLTW